MMARKTLFQRESIQRLLIAVAVVLAPLFANLPCCCKQVDASESSCCQKEKTTSCCSGRSGKSAQASSSCCDARKDPAKTLKSRTVSISGCECCARPDVPEAIVKDADRSAQKQKLSTLADMSIGEDLPRAELTLSIAGIQRAENISDKHNRHQSMLCVWRN